MISINSMNDTTELRGSEFADYLDSIGAIYSQEKFIFKVYAPDVVVEQLKDAKANLLFPFADLT